MIALHLKLNITDLATLNVPAFQISLQGPQPKQKTFQDTQLN